MTFNIKTILAIATLSVASLSHASETISIAWGFSIGSNQASTIRHIAEDANKSQSKYNFIVESKAGAGGSIAANHVLQNPSNTLVGMSSSFFIRPAVETVGVHDLDKFKPVLVQSIGAPLVIVSKKYKNINELLKEEKPSLGISGIGSISDMLANILKEKNPNLNLINYKGMVDATVAAAGGHVDAAVTFFIDAKPMIDAKEVTVIGYTGTKDLDDFKGLSLTKQGIAGVDKLVANYAIFSSREMPNAKAKEIHDILSRASINEKVRESYIKDNLTVVNIPLNNSQEWYDTERSYWKSLASKLPKSK
jgi:tripartite-type tricarboxylate transporter receptor subunit TctC